MNQVVENINNMLSTSLLNPQIYQVISDDSMSQKDQEKLLKGMDLTPIDILWLNKNKEAQEFRYLLDIYNGETSSVKFEEKQ